MLTDVSERCFIGLRGKVRAWGTLPWSTILLVAFFGVSLFASRWMLKPRQLFSGDSVNFAYAIGNFDTRISQPQPPGYPIFVLEMRMLTWLRVKQPESIMRILLLIGSAAAIFLLVLMGNRVFGGRAGLWAAFLMLFYPSFWLAGLTSPVRVQLAVVSVAVAGACWLLAEGKGRWRYWSTIILGIGAGIRPDLGPLLMPVWLWALFRAERHWVERIRCAALLTVVVLAWLLPAAFASGGLITYFRNCWVYLVDQVTLAPTVLDDTQDELFSSFARLLVWVGSGLLGLVLPTVLAWKRGEGFGFSRLQIGFLVLWAAPLLAFALGVHLADPGHAVSMVPIVCLIGGRLIDRAQESWTNQVSRFELTAGIMVVGLLQLYFLRPHLEQVLWTPALCAATGILLRFGRRVAPGWLSSWQAAAMLLLAPLLLNFAMFVQPLWGYKLSPEARKMEHFWSRVNTEVYALSLGLVRRVTDNDDRVLTQAQQWAAQRPDRTSIIWMNGVTDWRKVTFYLSRTPVYIATHATPSPETPHSLVRADGPAFHVIQQGALPLRIYVDAGERLIWILDGRTGLDREWVELGTSCTGHVCLTDLPEEPGALAQGATEVVWGSKLSESNVQ